MTQVTARLEQWYPQWNEELEEYVIWGAIYEDFYDRWPDGTGIHTSGILRSVHPPRDLEEGDVVATRNSSYRLGAVYDIKQPS